MAHRKSRRRDWRQVVFWIIAVMIALSMVLAYVLPGLPIGS
jgi:type VI protein secretion system component VasF